MVRFGRSGLPPEDVPAARFLDQVAERGEEAYELAFVDGFPWKERRCAEFGAAAAERGIRLSIHAPYFAILTVEDEERSARSLAALEHTLKLGKAMGAPIVCAHLGHVGDRGAEELTRLVAQRVERLAVKAARHGVGLGLETAGNDRSFGTLGDIAALAARFDFVRPIVDWAHLHAKTGGGLTSKEAFSAVFSFLAEAFPAWMIDPLQTQFTDNLVGPHGEVRHLPYGEGTLRVEPLVAAAAEAGVEMVVISEAREESSHEAIGAAIGAAATVAAVPPGRRLASADTRFPGERRVAADGPKHHRLDIGDRTLRISNVDKPLFPDGITKGDLVQYYLSVADVLLPHLVDRPISMSRYPDGIDAPGFYEKRTPGHAPDWIRKVVAGSEEIAYVTVEEPATLAWLASMACIEMHPFHSRGADLDHPTYAVFDFDPAEGSEWEQVTLAANTLKLAVEALGLRSYPKLSGSRGMHVYLPLEPVHDYERVRRFVAAVGSLLVEANPDDLTMAWDTARRKGKVFIDANRNARGQTVASVYSVRPRPGAPVSVPLRWDEVGVLRNGEITIVDLWERLARMGDLFAPVQGGGQVLDDAERALGLEPT